MNRFLQNRLLLQLLFTFVAAISVVALSIVLITEAVRSAEKVVVGEANQTIATAIRELGQQYQYRVSSDSSWSTLPMPAKDVSLRAITQTVLRSYQGVEGGFYEDSNFLGYAYPTHDRGLAKTDVPAAEHDLIVSLAEASQKTNHLVQRLLRGRTDLLVMAAVADGKNGTVIWAMKRLVGRNTQGTNGRELLLAVLVLAALISIAGTLATGLSLARGIAQIKSGLSALERDFEFHLTERSDELGGISRSINQMASVRRKLEDEVRREDRLRALGRLAAGLAHEIRNPLNSIRLTVQLLEHRWNTGSIRREDLQTVRKEVDRLSTLLNDLLDLQRSRQPHRQIQHVLPVLEHCIKLIEKQAEMQDTHIHLEMPETQLQACFDGQQLTQTVVNLLLNALEASPPGGTITVKAFEKSGVVQVQVRDQGPGLGPDQCEHLFEPFYTTKPDGTGLGLAVSRELMRSQGGDLLYTPDGAGAAFLVQLPRS
jgi:signal transduction histidine kinase